VLTVNRLSFTLFPSPLAALGAGSLPLEGIAKAAQASSLASKNAGGDAYATPHGWAFATSYPGRGAVRKELWSRLEAQILADENQKSSVKIWIIYG